MHVVDDVQRVHVHAGEPLHHVVELAHNVVVVERVALDGAILRADLLLGDLVHAAVERVEQALGQVRAGAEELHLLADAHGAHAAGDGVVVAMVHAHEVVVLVLDGARSDGGLGAELLEGLRQILRPQHRQVGLRRGAHVLERVEVAERRLGDEGAAVHAHAADGLGDPLRVAGEEVLILGGTGELDHAELHDEVVHELLDLLLGEGAAGEVALSVDVDEGRGAAHGHGGAVLLLHRSEVREVHPLDGLLRVLGRAGDVVAVEVGHHLELTQSANLLLQLLAVADVLLGHDLGRGGLLGLLVLDEVVHAVEGNATVVADDAAAAVAVGQTRDDVRRTAGAHLGSVDVKDALVVGLATEGVVLHHVVVDLVAVLLGRLHRDADTAVDVQSALERLIGLQTDDGLALGVLVVDVAGRVAHDARDHLGVHVEAAALLALLGKETHDVVPEVLGALGGTSEERLIAFIGGVVALDKVADVNLVGPGAALEAFPCFLHRVTTLLVRAGRCRLAYSGPGAHDGATVHTDCGTGRCNLTLAPHF